MFFLISSFAKVDKILLICNISFIKVDSSLHLFDIQSVSSVL